MSLYIRILQKFKFNDFIGFTVGLLSESSLFANVLFLKLDWSKTNFSVCDIIVKPCYCNTSSSYTETDYKVSYRWCVVFHNTHRANVSPNMSSKDWEGKDRWLMLESVLMNSDDSQLNLICFFTCWIDINIYFDTPWCSIWKPILYLKLVSLADNKDLSRFDWFLLSVLAWLTTLLHAL